MTLGGQIALLLMGICVVITGWFPLSRGKNVRGGKARLLGLMCLLPIPIGFGVSFVLGFLSHLLLQTQPVPQVFALLEFIVFVICLMAIMCLAELYANQQSKIS